MSSGIEYVRDQKGVIDRAAALVYAVALLGPAATTAAGAMIDTRSWNPFFTQERGGVMLCKFRSLPRNATEGVALETFDTFDPRASRFGSLIRRTGVDEYPQLLQVVSGQMFLYGLRPHVEQDNQRLHDADSHLFNDLTQAAAEAHMKPSVTSPSSLWRKSLRYDPTNPAVRKEVDIASMQKDLDYITTSASRAKDLRVMTRLPLEILRRTQMFEFPLQPELGEIDVFTECDQPRV